MSDTDQPWDPTPHDRGVLPRGPIGGNRPPAPVVRQGLGEGFPHVDGRCPACSSHSLFLGSGGFVTCARLDCPDPSAAADLLAEGGR